MSLILCAYLLESDMCYNIYTAAMHTTCRHAQDHCMMKGGIPRNGCLTQWRR